MMCYPMGRNAEALSDMAAQAGAGEAGDAAIGRAILEDLDQVFPRAPGGRLQTSLKRWFKIGALIPILGEPILTLL